MSKVEVKTLISVVLKTNIRLPERILCKYQGLVAFLYIYISPMILSLLSHLILLNDSFSESEQTSWHW